MIDRDHALPITRQASLLGMSRGAVYYLPRPTGVADLALMRRIDELHLEHPFMGARITATEFTDAVLGKGCELSMAGRGAWRDNVFVERLWRSVKYERVYLKAYASVSAARADIAEYMDWYNAARAHSSLADLTPDEHYFAKRQAMALAA